MPYLITGIGKMRDNHPLPEHSVAPGFGVLAFQKTASSLGFRGEQPVCGF